MKKYIHKAEFPEHPQIPNWWPFGKGILGKLTWAVIGNSDDPEPPDNYNPDKPLWQRRLFWYLRNPFHNFDFYLIGFRDHDRIIYGKEPKEIFIDGWNWYVANVIPYKWLWLPFISYQKQLKDKVFQFYLGWRHGASFGFKLRLHKLDKK